MIYDVILYVIWYIYVYIYIYIYIYIYNSLRMYEEHIKENYYRIVSLYVIKTRRTVFVKKLISSP